MSNKYGVNIINNKPVVSKWEDGLIYNYVVECAQIRNNNGNGLNRLKIYNNNNEYLPILKNNWSIQPIVDSPFSWSGSVIRPKLIDPNGTTREAYKDGYSSTIYQGLSFAKDIIALFTCLDEHSTFENWQAVDLDVLRNEKDLIISKLKNEITKLTERIKILEQSNP